MRRIAARELVLLLVGAGCGARASVDVEETGVDTDPCGGAAPVSVFDDLDGDGFGDPATGHESCEAGPEEVADATDCDDSSAAIYPGAAEVPYDGVDQDCDGSDLLDADGDGHGSEAYGGDDCDDADAAVHPGVVDLPCDGIDADCDGVGPQCELLLDDAGVVMEGTTAVDYAGTGLAFAGDVNGDGFADLLIGAPERNAEAGVAYLVNGPPVAGDLESIASARFTTTAPGESSWGQGVFPAGDVSGDGLADVWIGAETETYLFHAPFAGTLGPSDAVARLDNGRGAYDPLVSADVDGDGANDLLMGNGSNRVLLLDGPFLGPIATATSARLSVENVDCEPFGDLAEVLGDQDGDGVTDLLVGTIMADGFCEHPDRWGVAAIVGADRSGVIDMRFDAVDARVMNPIYAAVAPGDTNADGYADMAFFSVNAATGQSFVDVLLGPVQGDVSTLSEADRQIANQPDHGVGTDLVRSGDVDGDGFADLLGVGSTLPERAVDAALLWGGTQTGVSSIDDAEWFWYAELGDPTHVRGAGSADADGDGVLDLLVSAPAYQGGTGGGRIWFLSGGML